MSTSKIGIDFDGIFVKDIPNIVMTDKEYVSAIIGTPTLLLSKRLSELILKSDWYIITGRREYLKSITEKQLSLVVNQKQLKNFKGLHFNNTTKSTPDFKIDKSLGLCLDLFLESDENQTKQINKHIKAIHYES